MAFNLTVNGQSHKVEASPDTPLLWVLRDHIQLTGTKFGCGIAQCGACTVHLDGKPVRSCVMPLQAIAGMEVVTIEGLQSSEGKAVQTAWEELAVAQCGYCQSGQIMAAAALLADNGEPGDDDIDAAMSGNICRCCTYQRVRNGIKAASKNMHSTLAKSDAIS
ncbi:MAG: (2Fe-2S)-binding protein [Cellvibrionales bacterium TMED148]|nr:isoquinoline 1-oxidoreductase [Porticoccaceae bacterium]RPG91335.1 MAG: (2Fe-2S)-binding protein [Cellvibrionales bacterium TMED148]